MNLGWESKGVYKMKEVLMVNEKDKMRNECDVGGFKKLTIMSFGRLFFVFYCVCLFMTNVKLTIGG